ncbi:MAG: O-antigen ligase family protein, partial [Stenotrophobium sp.]
LDSAPIFTKHTFANQYSRPTTVEWLLGVAFFLCPATAWLLIPGTLSWSDAFFLAAILLFLIHVALNRTSLQVPIFIFIAAAFFIIAGLASFINNTSPLNLINWLKFLISLFAIPVVIMWMTSEDRESIDRMLWFWMAGTCVSALVAILSKYGILVPFLYDKAADFAGRPGGLTFHPNSLSYTCALLVPVAIYLAVTVHAKTARWISIAAIALLVDGILVSGSRGSLLAAFLGSLVWLPNPFKRFMHRSDFIALAVGALTITAVTFFILLSDKPFADPTSALSRLFGQSNQTQLSNDARSRAAENAYAKFEAAPIFGQGFEDIRISHNGGLQILQCSGIVGATGILLWWTGMIGCWLWLRLRGLALKQAVYRELMLLQMFQAIAVIVIVNGTVEPFLTDRNGYFPFGLLLGLWLSARSQQMTQNRLDIQSTSFKNTNTLIASRITKPH